MRKILSLVLVGAMLSTVSLIYAATGDSVSDDTGVSAPAPADTVAPAPADTVLSAAPVNPIPPFAGGAKGEYPSVSCSSNSAFSINSCDQCFDGGSVKVGERLTGLFDNWTNSSTLTTLSAYKEEQKTPNMVRFGNTTWTTTPAVEANVWKYASDVTWIMPKGETRTQFLLLPGQSIRFAEADLGAGYTLEKTDKKTGDLVGMLKYPVIFHTIDAAGAESATPTTHTECVAYKLDAPVVAPVATGAVKAPAPAQVTQTKTGPETLILIAAAFFIAFGMMFTLRRRM